VSFSIDTSSVSVGRQIAMTEKESFGIGVYRLTEINLLVNLLFVCDVF